MSTGGHFSKHIVTCICELMLQINIYCISFFLYEIVHLTCRRSRKILIIIYSFYSFGKFIMIILRV